MDTCVQMYRSDTQLTAVALGEPSITLIENDIAFSVLLSEGVHEDSTTARLYLDHAIHLRVRGSTWQYGDFQTVCLTCVNGLWIAQDIASGKYFHEPSIVSYRLIFISKSHFDSLLRARDEHTAYPIFAYSQRLFGRLPGFAFEGNTLTTPNNYAAEGSTFGASEYLTAK